MFNSVQLTNYRKHTDLTVNFEAGTNAIRASNEAGKSTVIEAVAYALFGAKALKETLAEVVTYGKKETELKVVLKFSMSNVDYTLKRGKSGAEITYVNQRVTGQTEVTKFVESLIGTSADVASKLMLAKQSSVTGAISQGSAGMVSLIEVLANFQLISDIIDLATDKLPSGNTSSLEAQISQLSVSAAEEVESKVPFLSKKVESLQMDKAVADTLATSLESLVPDIAAIGKELKRLEFEASQIAPLKMAIASYEYDLAKPMPDRGSDEAIAKYTKLHEQQKTVTGALAIKRELESLAPTLSLNMTEVAFNEHYKNQKQKLGVIDSILHSNRVEHATATQKLISETTCGLCGKDLTDVPEVVERNSKTTKELEDIAKEYEMALASKQVLENESKMLKEVASDTATLKLMYAKAKDYIEVTTEYMPPRYVWVGPVTVDFTDYRSLLKQEQDKNLAYATEEGSRAKLRTVLAERTALLEAIPKDIELRIAAVKVQHELAIQADTAFKEAKVAANEATMSLMSANAELSQEKAVVAEAQKRVDRAKVQLAIAQADLVEQNFNNALIKKLRLARPKVADKLWGMVLATVSNYFSVIRGEASTVTKTEDGFKVNGNPITGLSGSTTDALGLAIRIALTKTFVPYANFLILDEVASGMDDQREAAMLGFVSTCGMSQVILVTHSELADSFADNVITI